MIGFTDAQIDLITKARKILHKEAVDGGNNSRGRFTTFRGLARFVRANSFGAILRDNIDMTRGGLRQVTANLAAAHEAAANITVGEVPRNVVDDFVSKLRAVHEDVQSDQNFQRVSEIAGDLATTIENHAKG